MRVPGRKFDGYDKRAVALVVAGFVVLPGIVVRFLTNSVIACLSFIGGIILTIGLMIFFKRFLPASAGERISPRLGNWLALLLLLVNILPGTVFSPLPQPWRRYIALASVILVAVILIWPSPRRHNGNSAPTDSSHSSS